MTSYLRVNSAANTYAWISALAGLANAPNLRIEVDCALDDWASGTPRLLAQWFGTPSNRTAFLFYRSVGVQRLAVSSDGTAFTDIGTAVAPAAATRHTVACYWEADIGTQQRFTHTIDGTAPVGPQATTPDRPAGLYLSTYQIRVGEACTGNFYRARIWVNGFLLADADFTKLAVGQTSWTDNLGNAWALSGQAAIVDDGAHTEDCVYGDGTFGSGVYGCCAPEATDFTVPIGVGQRRGTFIFRAYKASGEFLGEIHPSASAPPTLSHDTSRAITREVSNFNLTPEDAELVAPLSARIKISYADNDGVEHKLGTFMYADAIGIRESYGTPRQDQLVDLTNILAQNTEQSFTVNPQSRIDAAILNLLNELAIWSDVEGSLALAGSPYTWPAGTSRIEILNELALDGGYLSPWFDRDDVLHLIRSFNPAERVPTFDYDEPGRIIPGSIREGNDLLSAPNRFMVIDNSNTLDPVVGIYDVPASAPHSIQNRGFVIVEVIERQGMSTDAQATDVAGAILTAQMRHETVNFSAVFDPRHDSWDVLRYRGENWLELAWSVTLTEGAPMNHTARKAYQ